MQELLQVQVAIVTRRHVVVSLIDDVKHLVCSQELAQVQFFLLDKLFEVVADVFLALLIENVDSIGHLLLDGQEGPEKFRLAFSCLTVRFQVERHLDLSEAEQV